MTVGIYSGFGTNNDKITRDVLRGMHQQYPDVTPIVLCLSTKDSVKWTLECADINPKLNAIVFMGSAPSRMLVEEWTRDFVLERMAWATNEVAQKGVTVIGATEHTTQTPPDFLADIIRTQVENGAQYFCIADTIGYADPIGASRITTFVKSELGKTNADVRVDWHGHRDRGYDISNAMAAIAAGADRVHTVARGIGERAGNTPFEPIAYNLSKIAERAGLSTNINLTMLDELLKSYDSLVNLSPPIHGPFSTNSHKTKVGIHTAAIYKARVLAKLALEEGDEKLAETLFRMSNTIYAAIPPEDVGKSYQVTVGPESGKSSVQVAAMTLGLSVESITEEIIDHVLRVAKSLGRELNEEELKRLLKNSN